MTCRPTELFIFADWLLNTRVDPPESVLLRTIINRAYYAALIAARDFTKSTTRGGRGHENVVIALRSVSSRAASLLNTMRAKRHDIDYELTRPVTIRDAMLSLQNSREILYVLGERLPAGATFSKDFLNSAKFVSGAEK